MNFSNSAAEAAVADILQPSLIGAEINPNCIASIVLPVRNEAEFLSKNLESFARQVDTNERAFDPNLFEIIVFANNCDDRSAEIARAWQRKNSRLNVHIAEAKICRKNSNIGFVRRLLMNEAFARLRRNRLRNGVILTTDGDTEIAPNWLAANLHEIKNGADAVGGRILIDVDELKKMNRNARRFHLLDTDYRLLAAEAEARLDYVSHDYLPRHHQHFNASFAVTTAAFERAGGIPKVRYLEDVAFYHALLRVDARFRHSPFVKVKTSARHRGRTAVGLSTQINEWTVMGEKGIEFLVESAAAIAERNRLKKNLRDLWLKAQHYKVFRAEISSAAEKMLVREDFVFNQLNEPQTFGCLYEKILHQQIKQGDWAKKHPLEEIEKSLYDLRMLARQLREKKSLAAHGL